MRLGLFNYSTLLLYQILPEASGLGFRTKRLNHYI